MPKPYKILLDELISTNKLDMFSSHIDKWVAHSNLYIRDASSLPHRAFSIFLFNSKNQLLLQQRSKQKRTFPLCWTNTCCSHPNMILYENGRKDIESIRDSLHRALDRELKIDLTQEKFYFQKKIVYKQLGYGDQQYGQFEVDYVYLAKLKTESVEHQIVEEQIREVAWVNRTDLPAFMEDKNKQGCNFTPWFIKMNQKGLLNQWWDKIEKNNLKDEPGENRFQTLDLTNQ